MRTDSNLGALKVDRRLSPDVYRSREDLDSCVVVLHVLLEADVGLEKFCEERLHPLVDGVDGGSELVEDRSVADRNGK